MQRLYRPLCCQFLCKSGGQVTIHQTPKETKLITHHSINNCVPWPTKQTNESPNQQKEYASSLTNESVHPPQELTNVITAHVYILSTHTLQLMPGKLNSLGHDRQEFFCIEAHDDILSTHTTTTHFFYLHLGCVGQASYPLVKFSLVLRAWHKDLYLQSAQ